MERYVPRPREQALEQIMAYILENKLSADDKLPPEREMCQMWGVNRCTLRSAIAALTEQGIVYAVQGSGTRIRHRFRISLDHLSSFSEAAVACGFQPETKLLSFTTVSRDEYLERIFYWAKADLFYKFSCLRLLNQDPVMINTAYFPADLAPGLTEYDLVNGSLFQTLEQSCRVKLKYGAAKISLKHVTTEEAGILNLAPGASAFQIITEINTDDSAPMGYVHSVGRADKIEMVSSMRWEREKENMP